jgi:hypothetical protein
MQAKFGIEGPGFLDAVGDDGEMVHALDLRCCGHAVPPLMMGGKSGAEPATAEGGGAALPDPFDRPPPLPHIPPPRPEGKDAAPMDVNEVIRQLVPGRSFADLGGLWGTLNERITPAMQAGCASATMIDEQPAGNALWQAFEAHCAARGVSGYRCVSATLQDAALPGRLGPFDVLHCSGVIYHCPDPFAALRQLWRLTEGDLLLGSMTVPARIANAAGALDLGEGRLLAVPALRGRTRDIVHQHFADLQLQAVRINLAPETPWWRSDGNADHAPWWWLFTAETLGAMAEAAGFRVRMIWEAWPGRAHYLHCERLA